METGMAASRMKSICLWKTSGDLVEADDEPPHHLQAAFLDPLDAGQQVGLHVLHLAGRALQSASGVSIPMNTLSKRAARISESSSSSSARLIDAW